MRNELDELVGTFFHVFDNRRARQADFAALQTMFVAGAVIAKRSSGSTEIHSLASFLHPRQILLTGGSRSESHEWEVAAETFIYGGSATRICRYRKEGVLNGNAYSGSGTKFLHLLHTEHGWKITSLLWEDAEGEPSQQQQRYASGAQ